MARRDRGSNACEQRFCAFGESGAAVLGRGRRGCGDEVAGVFDVAVGAAGEAEVRVVGLAKRGPVGACSQVWMSCAVANQASAWL